ncbi:helix-turn-helix domain-containing protein [Microtetraspora malaysiensis]|uniref:helix-turn-helix domain-containing protein n=1 Tax=Microtetraspora malaysiensis TaxID=161358 RepID=UPI003D924CF4
MDSAALLEKVRDLRGQGHSPKQIARALGVSPAVITPLVRAVAEQARGEETLGEVVGCWMSTGWSVGLTVDPARGWADQAAHDENTAGGMVSVLVARKQGWDKLLFCGYLVDTYCLGVKNTQGPEVGDEMKMRRFRERFFSAYEEGYQEAPVDLAQHLVFGAVEYARGLGLEPHEDFAATAEYLGPWTGPSAITFGKDGKPLYISGPYDDARKIVRTLTRAVGEPPNFDYILTMDQAATTFR